MSRLRRQATWVGIVVALGLGCEKEPPERVATSARPPPTSPPAARSAATTAAREPSSAPAPSEAAARPEEVAAQHILVAYRGAKRAAKGVTRTKAQAKQAALEVLAKARQGEDFSDLAREHSDCPSKANRGNLGKFRRESMDPKFSEAAFRLKVGEISDVVETPFGYHIIKRNQ
jgi:parvulin-like peptidyl-prolyl isomerase